jgi:hypothetical protein
MMTRWMDLEEGCSYQAIERKFSDRFQWKLPENWALMTRDMYPKAVCYKKPYMGWYPGVVT